MVLFVIFHCYFHYISPLPSSYFTTIFTIFYHYFHYIPLLSSPYSTTTFTIFYQPTFIIIINDPIDVFTEAQLSIPPNNTSFNNTFSLYNSIYLQTHQNNELTTNICQDNERILYKEKVFII